MAPNILITGASGYIGGSFLTSLLLAEVVPSSNIWGVVRSDAQADSLGTLKINTVKVSLTDTDALKRVVLENKIDLVIHTASAVNYALAGPLLDALKARKEATKQPVYFIQTSGASIFADKSGWTHGLVREKDDIYTLEEQTTTPYILRETDVAIQKAADKHGIHVYIVVPPLVYGKGTGLGNTISGQIPTLIRVAVAEKQVYRFDENTEWPAVHVDDLAQYYTSLTRLIVEHRPPPSGKEGYYLVSGHNFKWHDVLQALAEDMFSRELVSSPDPVVWPSEEFIVKALGIPPPYCYIAWNSNSAVVSDKHKQLNWKPRWSYDRFLQSMGEEVQAVLNSGTSGKSLADLLGL